MKARAIAAAASVTVASVAATLGLDMAGPGLSYGQLLLLAVLSLVEVIALLLVLKAMGLSGADRAKVERLGIEMEEVKAKLAELPALFAEQTETIKDAVKAVTLEVVRGAFDARALAETSKLEREIAALRKTSDRLRHLG